MSLTNEERQVLVQRELQKAHEAYEDIEIDYGHLYNNLQRLREKSDYNCFFDVSEQDIVDGIAIAADFIKAIEQLIAERNIC